MSDQSQVLERVARIFRESLNLEVPSVDTDLIDSGLLDSLALVELLFGIEQEFGIEVALDELDVERFRTLGGVATFVEEAA